MSADPQAWIRNPSRKLQRLLLKRHGSYSAAIEALERHGDDAFGPLPDDLAVVRAFGVKSWVPIFQDVYQGLGMVVSMTWWGAEPARRPMASSSARRVCPSCGGGRCPRRLAAPPPGFSA